MCGRRCAGAMMHCRGGRGQRRWGNRRAARHAKTSRETRHATHAALRRPHRNEAVGGSLPSSRGRSASRVIAPSPGGRDHSRTGTETLWLDTRARRNNDSRRHIGRVSREIDARKRATMREGQETACTMSGTRARQWTHTRRHGTSWTWHERHARMARAARAGQIWQ